MKNKTILVSIMALGGILISFDAITNISGAPAGNTGSPSSNGTTCAQSGCHVGGPAVSSQSINISSDIPASGFLPNTTYQITVTSDAGGAGHSRIGFQASVEDGNGHAGILSAGARNQKFGNYITHTSSGVSATGSVNSWTFSWNSGNASTDVTVYVASNFTNSNGLTTGDVIVTDTLRLSKASTAALEDHELRNFSVAPNPANNFTVVQNLFNANKIRIFDLQGQMIREFDSNYRESGYWKIDLNGINPGIYLLHSDNNSYGTRTLVISR